MPDNDVTPHERPALSSRINQLEVEMAKMEARLDGQLQVHSGALRAGNERFQKNESDLRDLAKERSTPWYQKSGLVAAIIFAVGLIITLLLKPSRDELQRVQSVAEQQTSILSVQVTDLKLQTNGLQKDLESVQSSQRKIEAQLDVVLDRLPPPRRPR